jgi:enamine deaminase RidA (YjgF/YER057c/UK114 family)
VDAKVKEVLKAKVEKADARVEEADARVEEAGARVEDVAKVASRLARVSVSQERSACFADYYADADSLSPEEIRNVDSPAVTDRRLGHVIASFRRGLVLD